MTKSNLSSLLKKLPSPHATYTAPGVWFLVYRAHALGRGRWENATLKKILELARSSYDRYGRRPRFDAYDEKSAIYLVRAIYASPRRGSVREEWLTIRMIPGDGTPTGVNEPEMFVAKGKSADAWMKKKIGTQNFWRHVASSSRMCGIHPYKRDARGTVTPLTDPSHRFTALCFALIHEQFVRDYPLSKFPYRYITAMIRQDFRKKGLSHRSGARHVEMKFTPAYTFLDMKKHDLHAKRQVYSYDFPLYWFDIPALLTLVNHVRRAAGKPIRTTLTPEMFKNLGAHNNRMISFAGVRMTPRHARALIDRDVPDAPELKITPAVIWYKNIRAILKAGKVNG